MNQSRYLFIDVISIIFQVILFIGNFLGLMYILEGNLALSFVGSALITILYFFLIQLLVDNKELMYKNKFKHATSSFWLFYVGLALISGYLLTHFINVEYNVKTEIQDSAYDKIRVVSNSIIQYKNISNEALEEYTNLFKEKVDRYKTTGNRFYYDELINPPFKLDPKSLANPGYLDVNKLIDAQLSPIQAKIENNLKLIDSVFRKNNNSYENVFANWKRLEIMQTYSNLNDYVLKSTNTINEKIQELPINNNPIAFEFDRSSLPLSSPSLLNKTYKPDYFTPLIILLIIHFFLILPFIGKQIRVYQNTSRNDLLPTERKVRRRRKEVDSELIDEDDTKEVITQRKSGGTIEL